MWFEEYDSLVIYLIASSAQSIISSLVKKKKAVWEGELVESFIKKEDKKKWKRIISKPQNFAKHADKDPDGVLSFIDDTVEFLLFTTVVEFNSLTEGESTNLQKMYYLVFLSINPEFISNMEHSEIIKTLICPYGMTKESFMDDRRKVFHYTDPEKFKDVKIRSFL